MKLLAGPAAHTAHSPVVWFTLAWTLGAVVVAAVVIALIVFVSRRPKSMETGIAEFSRSLQAVAPNHRSVARPPAASHVRPSPAKAPDEPPSRTRGETEAV